MHPRITALFIALLQGVSSIPLDSRADGACTFSGSDGFTNFVNSKGSCSTITISEMAVPAGKTLDMTNLKEGTTVLFQGTTTFDFAEGTAPLVSLSGRKISVRGDPGSVLDGRGAKYWDGQGAGGGRKKPAAMVQVDGLSDSSIEGITVLNAPTVAFSFSKAENVDVKDVSVNNRDGGQLGSDGKPLARNTNGVRIVDGKDLRVKGLKVYSQDGCFSVVSGSNIDFSNGLCSGGNGLIVGPVGQSGSTTVSNVTFSDTTIEDAQQAAVRIDTYSGATGSIADVTFRNIAISNGGAPGAGVVVDQTYGARDAGDNPPNGVSISNLRMDNVTGTVGANATNISVRCGLGDCRDWSWNSVKVTGGSKAGNCVNLPSGVSC